MKMLTLIALLIATPALAQELTVEQLDQAKRAMIERDAADRAAKVDASSVDAINIRVDMKAPEGTPRGPGSHQVQTDVVIHPGDPEFAAVLAAAKAAYARKATAAATELEAVGIAVEPEQK